MPVARAVRRRLVAAAVLLALAGCAGRATQSPAPVAGAAPPPAASALVVRDGDSWTVEFRFAKSSPVWAFSRSALKQDSRESWRPEGWTVETPGVRLSRRGWFDVLEAERGAVPPVVRVRFKPYAKALASSYDPALAFTDGSIALFAGQFSLFPIASAQAAEQLPLHGATPTRTAITFRDRRGRVLHEGRRQRNVRLDRADTYVLFGPARPMATDDMSAFLDPQLPPWIREFLASFIPQVMARYTDQFGPALKTKPTVMVAWAGPTPRVVSMAGSVLPDLMAITLEGEGVVRERLEMRNYARWFIAHESAHFWLGQVVRYENSRGAWITEGGADLLAVRTVQALDPAFDWKAMLNESIKDCASLTKGRGVATAAERGEHRAHYACGVLSGLLVERRSGQPFTAFVRALIDANRQDGVVSRADWLAVARARTGDPALVGWIEMLLDQGFTDPSAAIASELQRVGIPFQRPDASAPQLL